MSRLNQVLIVFLVLQGLAVIGVGVGREERRISAAEAVFPDLEPDAVTKITISGPTGIGDTESHAVTLVKSAGVWTIPSSGDYPAKADKVEELLSTLHKLKSRGPVVSKSGYHKKLEVAADRNQRKLTIESGAKKQELFLGTSPGHKKVHLRKADSDDVVMVDGLSTYEVGSRGSDWVDRNYLNFDEKDVWSVRIENAHGSMRLEKDAASGAWTAAGVDGAKIKQGTVDDLVRKSRSMTLEEPVGKGNKPAWGLDTPLATVTLVTGTSTTAGVPPMSTQTVTVRVGGKDGDKNRHFVRASNSEHVVLAPTWAVQPLIEKANQDLVEK